MARVARQRAASVGLYAHLISYYETELAAWVTNVNETHAPSEPFPCQRILDGLRAGESVNVPTLSLPKSARPVVENVVLLSHSRAIVGPDDTVRFTDDSWAEFWLDENGL
ncbi:hypothetical protein [Mycolicibacterium farcinogenes]|uniref:Uncharacterized protein n=1 Tax=Mycolicibacterium farcinogenes TaxID=1802 RepID=A0ACD1FJ45_MYCFR|nr:hypothetical protein [Mycolicibacterium farcinogenes]QZH66925.1 hypothetical protein K6L26_04370 [Mycolicibacterium farcinogenes]